MSVALNTGVSGLRAHQRMLDVIANNLANVNTVAFKSQRTLFGDLLYDTLREATGAGDNVSSTNPLQLGLGVKVTAIDPDFGQGNLEATGRPFDLAIRGDGFFVVFTNTDTLFTRAGAFGLDTNNYLIDPSTGYYVRRTGTVGEAEGFQVPGDNRIKIPFGELIPGKATKEITFQGNLSADATGPMAEVIATSAPLTVGGVPATGTTLLNDLDTNLVDYASGDSLIITGTDFDGSAVNTTLAVDATTTVQDLLDAINAAFSGATATLDAQGNIVLTANSTGETSLDLQIQDDPGNTGSTSWYEHAFEVVTDGKDGDTVTTSIKVYDSLGKAHTLTFTFEKVSDNVWDLTVTGDPSEVTILDGSVKGITFNDDGSFETVTGTGVDDANIAVQFAGLSTPQTIDLDFGQTGTYVGLTHLGGGSTAAATRQDGYGPGSLVNVSVNADGTIKGIFSNGQIISLAQLELATFGNPAGLKRVGDNYYQITANSGEPYLGTPTTGGRGSIERGVLESSNVDIAEQFTQMILAQRGFQVNARTITVTNEVLQEVTNLIR